MTAHDLDGARVLVVEDDVLIALDIADSLEKGGATVVGPCCTLSAAHEAACTMDVDLALLDVDLSGEKVFPVARILLTRGIPFMFQTGHNDRDILKSEFSDVPVRAKPVEPRRLLTELSALLRLAA
ncbi:response regulator [Pelagibacterium halotolerans]|uniref:response regulator n=1 Tax=Pelagibacterium halotolerans TaxID=531813 RepID=UPI00384E2C57